jgi:outer membrane protein
LGLNYTKFVSIQSKLAPSVQMSESMGMAWVGGVDYAITRQLGLYASASSLDVRSNVVGVASTVLTTSIDFRPVVYSIGASYKF